MRTKLKLHRHCSTSKSSTDAECRKNKKFSTKKKLSPAALACKRSASGGLMFITNEYVLKMMKSTVILDPEKYIIRPGLLINPMKINDMRPLLMDQIDDNKSIENTSAIVKLKKTAYWNLTKLQLMIVFFSNICKCLFITWFWRHIHLSLLVVII